jgi:hypothetical protein
VADNSLGRTKKYIEVSGRPGPTEFLSSTYSSHLDRYNLTFKIESIPDLDEIKLLYRKLMVMHGSRYSHLSFVRQRFRLLMDSVDAFFLSLPSPGHFYPFRSGLIQMNETYQKPGRWKELIFYTPLSLSRHDSRHFVMSYIIKQLEHDSVYEVMVQARNRYGWNEVRQLSSAPRRN